MESFDCWLRDTFPHITDQHPPCPPSGVNLKEMEVIPLVRLCFYNMSTFSDTSSIYDHIIIDSLYSVMLAPIDKKGKPIGLTDILNIPYSYANFKNKTATYYRDDMIWYQNHLKSLLAISKRNHAEALVCFSYSTSLLRFGYITDNKIYLCDPSSYQSYELDSFFKCHTLNTPYGLYHSDKVPISDYDYWKHRRTILNWNTELQPRLTGHTPSNLIRLCK